MRHTRFGLTQHGFVYLKVMCNPKTTDRATMNQQKKTPTRIVTLQTDKKEENNV
jgi:hypothetical protein